MTQVSDEQRPEGARAAQEAAAEAAPGQTDLEHASADGAHGQMGEAGITGSTDAGTGTGAVTDSGMPG
ncbi:hypothetical protein [Arsenicicoccus dermatophilus]|uniref:hypothetical protein n=1 Tax=Arsenicicoccus dermatophilus TaxID=1076331 RepID=UPI001F4CA7F1|nr:hypothetical protein [Arsenicicoccus dermatophilus]MCH8612841.1 hypothetical protein [Arsenicicoccus dermatophilus]